LRTSGGDGGSDLDSMDVDEIPADKDVSASANREIKGGNK